MTAYHPSRRAILALTGAAALYPGAALSQSKPLSPVAMNRLAALAGFDPLPRDLIRGLGEALSNDAQALEDLDADAPLPDDLRTRILTALYTGVTAGDDPRRIGFSSALMWAAIEYTNNVFSYCGGRPDFWASKPETS